MQLIKFFGAGLLTIAEGTTLRNYLSVQLHCVPMRITKKFSKDLSIGKVRVLAAVECSLFRVRVTRRWWCCCCRRRVALQQVYRSADASQRGAVLQAAQELRTLRQSFVQAVLHRARSPPGIGDAADEMPVDGGVKRQLLHSPVGMEASALIELATGFACLS